MNRSLSSILIVIISLIVAFGGTWFYLYTKAQAKPAKPPFDHAFTRTVHEGGKVALLIRVTSPSAVKNLPPSNSKFTIVPWLDVRLAGSNQLVVSPLELLEQGPAKGKPLEIASTEETKAASLYELSDFYDVIRDRPTVLNLIARRPGLSKILLEVWGEGKPLSFANILIQSESDGHLKELREAQARGLYGSSQATLIQIEVLSNLGLGGLMDLNSDVFVSAISEMNAGVTVPRVRPSTLEEAHRRGLKRYAGPTQTIEAAETLLKSGYDGVLVDNQALLELLLQQ